MKQKVKQTLCNNRGASEATTQSIYYFLIAIFAIIIMELLLCCVTAFRLSNAADTVARQIQLTGCISAETLDTYETAISSLGGLKEDSQNLKIYIDGNDEPDYTQNNISENTKYNIQLGTEFKVSVTGGFSIIGQSAFGSDIAVIDVSGHASGVSEVYWKSTSGN